MLQKVSIHGSIAVSTSMAQRQPPSIYEPHAQLQATRFLVTLRAAGFGADLVIFLPSLDGFAVFFPFDFAMVAACSGGEKIIVSSGVWGEVRRPPTGRMPWS